MSYKIYIVLIPKTIILTVSICYPPPPHQKKNNKKLVVIQKLDWFPAEEMM